MCAAGGLVNPAVSGGLFERLFTLEEDALLPLRKLDRVGTKLEGELARLGAPGHPHSVCSLNKVADSGDVYAGKAMLACVARHERMWNGESMEISKCLRFVGST